MSHKPLATRSGSHHGRSGSQHRQANGPASGRPAPDSDPDVFKPHATYPIAAPPLSEEDDEPTVKVTSIQTIPSGPTLTIKHYQEEVLTGGNKEGGSKDEFRVLKELGKGGFGVVRLCETNPIHVRFLTVT